MKKKLILLPCALIALFVISMIGCSKDDTTAPDITILGDASMVVSLNSGAFTDPGATANDDEDGAVTVTSDFSSSNPNTGRVGTYSISYSATDKAGNTQVEVRTVRVKNDAEDFAGNYNVDDSVPGDIYHYPQTIYVDSTLNNRVHFNKFGNYLNNTSVYGTKLGNGDLEIPAQTTPNSIGDGDPNPDSCYVCIHHFQSTSYTALTHGFKLAYTDGTTFPTPCQGSFNGWMTFTKQ